MPAEGIDFSDREDLLSYEEIIRLSTVFAELGVTKVRLTGGEPFVRKDIDKLLRGLAQLFPKVHITTNATRLEVEVLQEIGVAGLNISLDSLDRDKFFLITRRDESVRVMENIHKCIAANLPIKINMVVMKGVNDMEILDFIAFGMEHKVPVRFIEAMPFNEGDGNRDVFLSSDDILKIVRTRYSADGLHSDSPSSALSYISEGGYRFGIIPAYTRSLCGTCNRIRLTPKGELLNCLYSQSGTDLRSLIRNEGTTNERIREVITDSVFHKLKDGYLAEAEKDGEVFRSMTTIGG